MTIFKEKQKIDCGSENGIWLDYQNHTWLFFIKDEIWQKEEVNAVNHSNITVSFIQKGISDAFLLEIFDCLEASDLPFCVKEAEEDVMKSFTDTVDYAYEVVLVNQDNEVCAVKSHPFKKEFSHLLKKKLMERMEENFTVADAENSYEKLQSKYEPFELEQFAVFTQKN